MSTKCNTLLDTLSLELTTPIVDDRPVYITGNFCNWAPGDEKFMMQRVAAGRYIFHFAKEEVLPSVVEYKYTRGSWDQVELDTNGNPSVNRVTDKKKGWLQDFVPRWGANKAVTPTDYSPIVEVLADDFAGSKPQARRRIRVILPYNYFADTNRRYPVMYISDAHNLFGEDLTQSVSTVERKMKELASRGKGDIIIVTIDNLDSEQVHEFSPYDNPGLGKGQGTMLLRFLMNTLKPKIDSLYRTLSDRKNTGIGGSAMGGLLSAYAGVMYPDIFGRLMIFSPSLWVSEKIFYDAFHFFEPYPTRVYLYAGEEGEEEEVPSVKRLSDTLVQQGYGYKHVQVTLTMDKEGDDRERWAEQFPKALEWLYFE
ncbi:alpha/beta hydrolase-fold protein [Telluribacter sp. SYSU D00476]|uniref:alpha/beta hydrolase-fold protein n=1 Tax=Telluribacter sp. SYSU D00476 TaxID=2811430 RepID=UPI001FF3A22B|nr:alpha/beta hydrolase-fold protein [Telluribacter sp. SYSU D00476]